MKAVSLFENGKGLAANETKKDPQKRTRIQTTVPCFVWPTLMRSFSDAPVGIEPSIFPTVDLIFSI